MDLAIIGGATLAGGLAGLASWWWFGRHPIPEEPRTSVGEALAPVTGRLVDALHARAVTILSEPFDASRYPDWPSYKEKP
jgi:hypothetical protein